MHKKRLERLTEQEHLMRTLAIQRKSEEQSKFEDEIYHTAHLGVPGNLLLGHLPTLDETEGSE